MKNIAVVTRTKDREILLHRALQSVKDQTYKDLVWVVVNDGGAPEGVDRICAEAKNAGIETKVIHNPSSLGMEAASNKGITSVDSKYIIIHDDDDSWKPDFLQKTVDFLESDNGSHFGGVVTHSDKIIERMDENSCTIVGSEPFNYWLTQIYLSDMAKVNMFPPISFLFRRYVYDEVGGFDESLRVLGDWDFNLRFLLKEDIYCLPEALANYHHREATESCEAYQNTVVHGVDSHQTTDTIIRNKHLRNDIENGTAGLGQLLTNGKDRFAVESRFNSLFGVLESAKGSKLGSFVCKWFGIQ